MFIHYSKVKKNLISRLNPKYKKKVYNSSSFFHSNSKFFQKKDFYELLGLNRNANEKEIKQAFFQKS